MIGASKLTKEDAEKMRQLSKEGLTDGKVAEMFGVCREHARAIRIGKRWNPNKRSFLMSDELSQVKVPVTPPQVKYFVFVTINGRLLECTEVKEEDVVKSQLPFNSTYVRDNVVEVYFDLTV